VRHQVGLHILVADISVKSGVVVVLNQNVSQASSGSFRFSARRDFNNSADVYSIITRSKPLSSPKGRAIELMLRMCSSSTKDDSSLAGLCRRGSQLAVLTNI